MMLSRIADSLFWLNRYMERADGLLRVTRTNYIMSLDKGVDSSLTWRPALKIFSRLDEEECALLENDTPAALRKLLVDVENVNSLKVIVTRARENARGAQDHITKEVWEQLNQMYHLVNQPAFVHNIMDFKALESIDGLMRQSLFVQRHHRGNHAPGPRMAIFEPWPVYRAVTDNDRDDRPSIRSDQLRPAGSA